VAVAAGTACGCVFVHCYSQVFVTLEHIIFFAEVYVFCCCCIQADQEDTPEHTYQATFDTSPEGEANTAAYVTTYIHLLTHHAPTPHTPTTRPCLARFLCVVLHPTDSSTRTRTHPSCMLTHLECHTCCGLTSELSLQSRLEGTTPAVRHTCIPTHISTSPHIYPQAPSQHKHPCQTR